MDAASKWKPADPAFRRERYLGARAILRDIGERMAAQRNTNACGASCCGAENGSPGPVDRGIAHDFNNILGAVLGYTNLTLDRYRNELPAKAAAISMK